MGRTEDCEGSVIFNLKELGIFRKCNLCVLKKILSKLLASPFRGNTLGAQMAGWILLATLWSIKYVTDIFNLEGIIPTFGTHWDPQTRTNHSINVS